MVSGGRNHASYPVRFHKHVEIVYVSEGVMEVTIDGKPYTLRDGDLYIVFPNLLHSVSRADASKKLIMVSPELFAPLGDTLSRCKPVCPVLRKEQCPAIVGDLCQRMHELYRQDFHRNYSALSSHANSLINELMLLMPLEERKSDGDLVQRLVLYLLENYIEEVSLESVATALGYSKYHLSHVIADTFGCNFRTLINSYRVSMAQNLMLSTGRSVSDVAFACGFKNQSSFNRVFLKHCGLTPSAFRQQAQTAPEEPRLYRK